MGTDPAEGKGNVDKVAPKKFSMDDFKRVVKDFFSPASTIKELQDAFRGKSNSAKPRQKLTP
jgi:hypothetical protein